MMGKPIQGQGADGIKTFFSSGGELLYACSPHLIKPYFCLYDCYMDRTIYAEEVKS